MVERLWMNHPPKGCVTLQMTDDDLQFTRLRAVAPATEYNATTTSSVPLGVPIPKRSTQQQQYAYGGMMLDMDNTDVGIDYDDDMYSMGNMMANNTGSFGMPQPHVTLPNVGLSSSMGAAPSTSSLFLTSFPPSSSVGAQMLGTTGLGLYTDPGTSSPSMPPLWGGVSVKMELDDEDAVPCQMDDDDIFQVDKADLIQGPTLAELNANDETLLDVNIDDLLFPDDKLLSRTLLQPASENSNGADSSGMFAQSSSTTTTPETVPYQHNFQPSSFPPQSYSMPTHYTTPTMSTPQPPSPFTSTTPTRRPHARPHHHARTSTSSALHQLLLESQLGKSAPTSRSATRPVASPEVAIPTTTRVATRLSSSAPTHTGQHSGFEQMWQRREPRPHLLSTGSIVEAGSTTSSLSAGDVLSPASHDLSHDEDFDSDEDSEHYEDFSDDDSGSDDEGGRDASGPGGHQQRVKGKERHFWQYNLQSKGPKGQRLVLTHKLEDPHVLHEVLDPVFSPNCAIQGIKHSGKARKGDGNDLTPNPRKLYAIGRELDKLSREINDMTPVAELPFNARPKSRKEKNKLASRACRLKKKAQHEANKLKLYGLENEHKRLIQSLEQARGLMANYCRQTGSVSREEALGRIERLIRFNNKTRIAGQTTEYVNKVLEKVKGGVPNGGLTDL